MRRVITIHLNIFFLRKGFVTLIYPNDNDMFERK